MIDKLFIKTICCDETSTGEITYEVDSCRPPWYIHGVCILHAYSVDREVDINSPDAEWFHIAIYAEGDILDEGVLCGHDYQDYDTPLTDEEVETIETCAAVDAIKAAINKDSVTDFGDILLNKHPECRQSRSINMAVINAALRERGETFSNEDYFN